MTLGLSSVMGHYSEPVLNKWPKKAQHGLVLELSSGVTPG